MNDLGKTIVISIMFLSLTAIFVLRGPLGRAFADRIAGRTRDQLGDGETVRADLEGLQQRLAEVEERLDFTERLLAKQRDAERLAPPR